MTVSRSIELQRHLVEYRPVTDWSYTAQLEGEIVFVDAAIGQFVADLEARHLYSSTTIIITAKHGHLPIDPSRFYPVPGKPLAACA